MATGTRLLLRLPSSLRQHILLDPSRSFGRPNATITARTYAQQGRPPPPAPKPKPFDNYQQPSAAPLPKPKVTRPTQANSAPGHSGANQESKQNTILLYTSPSHGVFYVASYLAGGFFVLGAYTYSELVLKDPPDGSKQPLWKKLIGAVSALAAASFGTVFLLGPMGLIKSISIVTSETAFLNATAKFSRAPRKLRMEIKRKLPFLKPDVIETDLNNVALDRRVPVALQDLNFASIPISQAEAWTASYLAGAAEPAKHGVTAAVKGLWPATRREVRRMFLRDQIAYVSVKGNGNFKLDLQNCRMLEGGKALDRVLAEDLAMNRGIFTWINNLIRG